MSYFPISSPAQITNSGSNPERVTFNGNNVNIISSGASPSYTITLNNNQIDLINSLLNYQISLVDNQITLTGTPTNTGQVNFNDGTNSVSVQAPQTLTSNIDFVLPNSEGVSNNVLTIGNTPGHTEWKNVNDILKDDGRSLPLSFRILRNNNTQVRTGSPTYQSCAIFRLNNITIDEITKVFVIGETQDSNAFAQYRLLNIENGLTIAVSPYINNTNPDNIELNALGQHLSGRWVRDGTSQTEIIINNVNITNVTNASGTGFTSPFTITLINGGTGTENEITEIDTNGSTPGTIDGTWFALYYDSGADDYIFYWYDVDNSGTPQPVNPLTIGPGNIIYEITTIVTGDTDEDIARKTAEQINIGADNGSNNIQNQSVDGGLVALQFRNPVGSNAYILGAQIY